MISLRKLIDVQQADLLDSALDSYRASLVAMGNGGVLSHPQLGQALQERLVALKDQLSRQATPETLGEIAHNVDEELQRWGKGSADYNKQKATEVKEIMLMVAQTAQAIGDRDMRYAGQFTELSTRLQAIAVLDDLTAIRESLVHSVAQLRSSTDRMVKDGQEQVTSLRAEIVAYQKRLDDAEQLAFVDPLTGLDNRRRVEKKLQSRVAAARKFCVIILDVNGFKDINDAFGHLAGDDVLRQFAAELRSLFRSTDVIGRWGGDEFVAILECGIEDAHRRIVSVRKAAFGDYKLSVGDSPTVKVSASIGVAEWMPGESAVDVIERADASMYRDKSNFRRKMLSETSAKAATPDRKQEHRPDRRS